MAGAGATYLFAVYSNDIKRNLEYNQSMLNTLSSWKDIGTSAGILSGLVAEVTPTWFVLAICSVTNFLGYFMIWLAVTRRIRKPELWHMCAYMFIGANSQNFANTGSLVTCVKNFQESRSIMLGLLKGYVGLSGSILTQIYLAIYGDGDSTSLILLTAWLPALISVVVMYTIREKEVKIRQPNEVKVFYQFLYLSAALAVFLMTITLVQKHVAFSQTAYIASAVAVCILLFLPSIVAFRQEVLIWKEMKAPPTTIIVEKRHAIEQEQNSSIKEAEEETTKTSFLVDILNKPKRGEDYGILQALLSIDMLIIFLATLVGLGSGLTVVDNMGQIGEALGYEPKTTKTFMSLISVWNYAGRVFSGFLSETLLMKYKVPRPLMLSAVLFLACIGQLMIAFPFQNSIYLASLIIGFALGAQLPLVLSIISEIFGLKHYSTLFNCGLIASPIGSYLLNKELTGRLYDIETTKLHGIKALGKPLICKGNQCYGLSFKIMAVATFTGALISLILVARTLEFYKTDIQRRYRGETYAKFNEKEKEIEMPSSSDNEAK
ncbi:uncharacterized protein LOC132163886 [Corylus avellana]|uniref:uncharacterized protein LOC132163886 n=1 Tax=Corylus avellana TaxID=13451 RepID=UPI00286B7887|nr:uncharacterized protein LOC132163886 [Corylus avellana]